jgi:hypothetical protein
LYDVDVCGRVSPVLSWRRLRVLVGLLAAGLVAGGIVALILTRGGNRRNPGAGGESSGARSEAGGAAARPNIVFVLTDDLSVNLVQFMPHVLAMERAGLTFEDYFVSDSLCCPSRASIFTADFPHDTGVFSNFGPGGGFRAFYRHGNERHTFPLGMQRAGYATALMGKFLNGYLESSGHGHVSDGEVTNVPALRPTGLYRLGRGRVGLPRVQLHPQPGRRAALLRGQLTPPELKRLHRGLSRPERCHGARRCWAAMHVSE